jgi:predicted RNase H-like HicB family nuclease
MGTQRQESPYTGTQVPTQIPTPLPSCSQKHGMSVYIAFVHKDVTFGISFLDFPGVVTAGETLNAAVDLARETLTFHIAGMIEDGEEIPLPSTFEQVTARADYDALVLVPVLNLR